MNARIRLISIGLLLCVALGVTVAGAVQIVHAVNRAQHSHQAVVSGDVQSLRPWMTLHYIARVYHVPESTLVQAIGITDATTVRHATVQTLARRLHRTVTDVIQVLQTTILRYRQQHPPPTPSPHAMVRVRGGIAP